MDKFLIFTIVGLSTAAIYAVIGSGLVLTYTTTGVFNFAQGAAGMLAAFIYWQMTIGWGWPTPVAMVLVLFVLAPLFGVLLERVIFRGLEGTSEATKLVVSISLLVAMIGLSQWIWGPERGPGGAALLRRRQAQPRAHHHHLPPADHDRRGRRGGGRPAPPAVPHAASGWPCGRWWTTVRWPLLNGARTPMVARFELGHRHVAGRARRHPDRLRRPGSAPPVLSLLIVNAYGAAVFGRLRSLPMTFVGAIVLGCPDGYLAGYLPTSGKRGPYRGRAAPGLAGDPAVHRAAGCCPTSGCAATCAAREFFPAPTTKGLLLFSGLTLAFGMVLATTLSKHDLLSYAKIFSIGIVALSLVPLVGFAGQISLCQLSFAGIGAIVMAHLGAGGNPIGAGGRGGGLRARSAPWSALPALRLSGIYMALATAAFAVLLDRWIFVLPNFSIGPVHISIFELGTLTVDPLKLFGVHFSTARVADGPGGGRLRAHVAAWWWRSGAAPSDAACWPSATARPRAPPSASTSSGTRLAVFMLSAAIAGLGGAIYATQLTVDRPQQLRLRDRAARSSCWWSSAAPASWAARCWPASPSTACCRFCATMWAWFANIETLTPGLAGIGLGRQPSGAAPQFSAGFAAAARRHAGARLDAGGHGRGVGPAPRRRDRQLADGRAVRRGVRSSAMMVVRAAGRAGVYAAAARQAMGDTPARTTSARARPGR